MKRHTLAVRFALREARALGVLRRHVIHGVTADIYVMGHLRGAAWLHATGFKDEAGQKPSTRYCRQAATGHVSEIRGPTMPRVPDTLPARSRLRHAIPAAVVSRQLGDPLNAKR